MRIIGIDTSTKATGVALYSENRLEGCTIVEQERTRAEELLPVLEEQLNAAGLEFDEINAIAVAVGPGSFTGLRIGVTIAKTLAQFSGKRLVGISTLRALSESGEDFDMAKMLRCPVIDARADRIFAACYSGVGAPVEELIPEGLYTERDFRTRVEELRSTRPEQGICWLGQGMERHRALLEGWSCPVKEATGAATHSPVAAVCRLAQERLSAGASDSPLDLAPNYLRKSQAEMDQGKRNA
ncbi:MAG: tRNA (adenosine(37)-N6)-threonylcarbamoyltransferase complex dimerization subunit type 1 TsaB [Ndongobacter sp.]|nr:tRNA (adenosine(37)-N6)-threonylcarbamoyltransferase complex dimerization subunit type 1 TsaB [Ndongobacter sp.]